MAMRRSLAKKRNTYTQWRTNDLGVMIYAGHLELRAVVSDSKTCLCSCGTGGIGLGAFARYPRCQGVYSILHVRLIYTWGERGSYTTRALEDTDTRTFAWCRQKHGIIEHIFGHVAKLDRVVQLLEQVHESRNLVAVHQVDSTAAPAGASEAGTERAVLTGDVHDKIQLG